MDSETPIENALSGVGTVETPTPAPADKKSKGPVLGMALLAILALAGIGFGIYMFMDSSKKADEIKDLKNQIAQLTPTTPDTPTDEDLFETMDAEVQSVVSSLKSVLTPIAGVEPATDGEHSVIGINDDLYVYTALDKAYFISYTTDGIVNELYDKAIEKLNSLGFTEDTSANIMFRHAYVNSEGIVCNITGAQSPFKIGCGYNKWISSETTVAINEFAEAYKNKMGNYPAFPLQIWDEDVVTDSTVSPYQRIDISGGNAAQLFYRVSPDAEWQYFTGTQEALSCSEYNTQDLKNAYAGTTCYDEAAGANSTVQP